MAAPRGPARDGRPSPPGRRRVAARRPVARVAGGARHRRRGAAWPPDRAARPRPRRSRRRGRSPARGPPRRPAARPTPARPCPRRSAGGWSGRGTGRSRATALVGDPPPSPPGRIRRQPVFVRRTPSASAGPPTSPALAGASPSSVRVPAAGAWRSHALNRLAAFEVPWRTHDSTASAEASSRIGSRAVSSAVNRLGRGRPRHAPGSPIPTRRRLNFSLLRSAMIERSPLWPPCDPASRNRSLPNGSAKSSATTSRSRAARGSSEQLAHGDARSRSCRSGASRARAPGRRPGSPAPTTRRDRGHGRPSRPGRRPGRAPSSRCCGGSPRTGCPGSPGRRRASRAAASSTSRSADVGCADTANGPGTVSDGARSPWYRGPDPVSRRPAPAPRSPSRGSAGRRLASV